ncbi:hypothetical protein, partial [Labrenzia sp. 011]|uniref:hypothetical protein n=1 Tax=Labrenzia sp. 011 TaxID=2171494 RepID=UPI00197B62C3
MKHDGQFKKGNLHPRAVSLTERLQEIKKLNLGTLKIVSKIWRGERSRQLIQAKCTYCKKTMTLDVYNIVSGKTTNCRCQRRNKYSNYNK